MIWKLKSCEWSSATFARSLGLTSVGLQLLAVVNQGIVVEAQVDLDGRDGSLVVEGMHPEHVLQLQ